MSFPVGTIIFTDQVTIPDKWNICDGGTYDGIVTPDLIGRFIRACNIDAQLKAIGGAETHVHPLSASNTASGGSHGHANVVGQSATPSGTFPSTAGSGGINFATASHVHDITVSITSGGAHVHTLPANTGSANHVPQHIALCPIMRTKE